jgi:hypothetical protein
MFYVYVVQFTMEIGGIFDVLYQLVIISAFFWGGGVDKSFYG